MTGFDERDLIRPFVDAGFESVDLTYEVSRRRTRGRPHEIAAFLTMRPNPNMVSYEEAAREVLGDAADEHLEALTAALRTCGTRPIMPRRLAAAKPVERALCRNRRG